MNDMHFVLPAVLCQNHTYHSESIKGGKEQKNCNCLNEVSLHFSKYGMLNISGDGVLMLTS